MSKYDWEEPRKGGAVEKAADAVQKATAQAGNAVRGSFYTICLLAIIALEILRRFVSGGINEAFSPALVFSALITSMTTLLTFYIFLPSGKGSGMAKRAYQAALTLMERVTACINNGLQTAFRAFCKRRAELEAEEELEAAFETLENLYVTREEFEQKWRLASRFALWRAVRRGEITKEAKRQILRCRKPIAVVPYVPEYFLAGVNAKKQKKMLRNDSAYEVWVLVQKPVALMILAVVQSGFTMAFLGVDSAFDVVLAIVMSVFQICLAAFSGFLAGQKIAEHRTTVNVVKTGFMLEFLESEGIVLEEQAEEKEA